MKSYKLVNHFNGWEDDKIYPQADFNKLVEKLEKKRKEFYLKNSLHSICTLGITYADDVWKFNFKRNKWEWQKP